MASKSAYKAVASARRIFPSSRNGMRKVPQSYRKILLSLRKRSPGEHYVVNIQKAFHQKASAKKEELLRITHAQNYATMLTSLETYEGLLKEEGWGEPRNQPKHLQNLANYCGLEMPKPFLDRIEEAQTEIMNQSAFSRK
ncbi:hypothetical protein AAMO2058_000496800 [Amorphochlora amoebiformis]